TVARPRGREGGRPLGSFGKHCGVACSIRERGDRQSLPDRKRAVTARQATDGVVRADLPSCVGRATTKIGAVIILSTWPGARIRVRRTDESPLRQDKRCVIG